MSLCDAARDERVSVGESDQTNLKLVSWFRLRTGGRIFAIFFSFESITLRERRMDAQEEASKHDKGQEDERRP